MKFAVKTKPFADAVKLCGQVVPHKSPKEILRNIKIHAGSDGTLTLTATDTEISIRVNISAGVEVKQPGAALVTVAKASQILGEMTDESVSLETNGSRLLLTSAHSKFQLLSADPDEFPDVSPKMPASYSYVNAIELERAIHRCVFCSDSESTRYALSAIHLVEDGDKLAVVSTDGRRLAVQYINVQSVCEHRFDRSNCLVPERAAKMLARACASHHGDVGIAVSTNDVIFDLVDCQIVTRMVEGRYPNWHQVIPNVDRNYSVARFMAGPFLAAVRQAAIATGPESKGVDFTFAAGVVKLEAETADIGASTVELVGEFDDEFEVCRIKLDNTFVREFLNVLPLDACCSWHLGGSKSSVLVTTDDGYKHVVMPMTL